MKTLKFPNIHKSLASFQINACCLNKNDLDHILKCTNKVADIIAVSETRIIKFTPTESSAGAHSFTLLVTCLIKLVLILRFIKLTS